MTTTQNDRVQSFFGAKPLGNGRVLFSLWRPDLVGHEQGGPTLLLDDGKGSTLELAMEHKENGFWQIETDKASTGTRYKYRAWNTGGGFMAEFPDPASRKQADGHFGPSVVTDPDNYEWKIKGWQGRPQHELVLQEIHIGTFTKEGTFGAATRHLDELKELGITGLWVMPIAERPGGENSRSWGYDGTLWYAPAKAYGEPEDVKRFVDACHERGISVFLDVVYNHFGPDGNGAWGTPLVKSDYKTPWGEVVDYSTKEAQDFAIQNAKMWVEEYGFDGLRLDAIHGILPEEAYRYSTGKVEPLFASGERKEFVTRLTQEVSEAGKGRNVIVFVENERNQRSWLDRDGSAVVHAAITDDFHHAAHVHATGEHHGYYAAYAENPMRTLATCLTEGMGFDVADSPRNHDLSNADREAVFDPATIINFVQNHDQVGNRAFGERLRVQLEDDPNGPAKMAALRRLLYLSPTIPCNFMGEEFGAKTPFQFFCSFEDPACKEGVVKGRREEFKSFPEFTDPAAREKIPNPLAIETFERSKLARPADVRNHPDWQATKALIAERNDKIVPHLASGLADVECLYSEQVVDVAYTFNDGAVYRLTANLSGKPARALLAEPVANGAKSAFAGSARALAPWSVNAAVVKDARTPSLTSTPKPDEPRP